MMTLKKHQLHIDTANNDDKKPEEPAVETVPDPIIEDILSRAPAKTVLRCRTLNKSWLRALDSPTFSRSHFSRAPVIPLVVFGEKSTKGSSRIMLPIEGQNVPDLDLKISKSQVTSRKYSTPKTVSSGIRSRFLCWIHNSVSCEGLVCWVSYYKSGDGYATISNPITGEYASVSVSPVDEETDYLFIGMGFRRSIHKFELLRVCGLEVEVFDEVSHWWPEVRIVGDGQWRRVGDSIYTSTFGMFENGISQVVYVNGAIYWHSEVSSFSNSDLCCFNFDRGVFEVIPLPQTIVLATEGFYHSQNMKLGVLGNSVCVSTILLDDGPVELWILKNGVSQVEWSKVYHIEISTTCKTFLEDGVPQFKAIKYLDSGEILMHDCGGKFVVYDPTIRELKQLCVLEDCCLEDLSKDGILYTEVIPHVPCLVNLTQALNVDEERLKMMEEEAKDKLWLIK